jgi:Short C-terminal domain/Phospholipase_D-nuclease N-terminal
MMQGAYVVPYNATKRRQRDDLGWAHPGRGNVVNLGDWLWAMLVFFFWFMAIWIFIRIFADIFHRRDLSGAGKAGWILLLFVLPFLGALIYLIARPKMTEQDREDIQRMQEVQRRVSGYSAADEIDKLSKLRDSGEISAEEYERLKARALVEI